ncbi:MAG: hypothetical protein JWP97_4280 [Labilithrix sp.]|nr:hypothetical protein [Labilithrix sp.]
MVLEDRSMLRLSVLSVIGLVALAGCSVETGDEAAPDDTSDALIGGQPGAMAKFPSTVYLKGECTAAKVGPRRLLTAAHCVVDPATVSIRYAKGSKLSITRDPSKGYTDVVVESVAVHPEWLKLCEQSFCAASAVTAKLDAPDVAVITLAEDDAIPVAPVDAAPLGSKERVTVVGYGCTVGVLQPDSRDVASLQFATARLASPGRVVHEGSPITSALVPQTEGNYVITLGPGAAKSHAGLCPGDSGGPVYAQHGGRLVVVGVNSNYTLAPDDVDTVGMPITNWHTRLDDKSRHQVGAWLRSVGVGLR